MAMMMAMDPNLFVQMLGSTMSIMNTVPGMTNTKMPKAETAAPKVPAAKQ